MPLGATLYLKKLFPLVVRGATSEIGFGLCSSTETDEDSMRPVEIVSPVVCGATGIWHNDFALSEGRTES